MDTCGSRGKVPVTIRYRWTGQNKSKGNGTRTSRPAGIIRRLEGVDFGRTFLQALSARLAASDALALATWFDACFGQWMDLESNTPVTPPRKKNEYISSGVTYHSTSSYGRAFTRSSAGRSENFPRQLRPIAPDVATLLAGNFTASQRAATTRGLDNCRGN